MPPSSVKQIACSPSRPVHSHDSNRTGPAAKAAGPGLSRMPAALLQQISYALLAASALKLQAKGKPRLVYRVRAAARGHIYRQEAEVQAHPVG